MPSPPAGSVACVGAQGLRVGAHDLIFFWGGGPDSEPYDLNPNVNPKHETS